jgi:transcriptional regulator with XRE-family HTH domain
MRTPAEIRELRLRLGWSQQQLAEYLDVDQSTVSYLETKRKRDISGPMRALLERWAAEMEGAA